MSPRTAVAERRLEPAGVSEGRRRRAAAPRLRAQRVGPAPDAAANESPGLFAAAALLSASVLADSAVEHYRGQFRNPAMVTPLASATAMLGVAASALKGGRTPRPARSIFGAAVAAGAAGLAFHVFNVGKRPGGFNWLNLFYAAPLGAPAALSLAGLNGLAALEVRDGATRLFGLPAGRALSALTSLGLLGTSMEAGLLHFRGAFQNPGMWVPVTLPPVGAALLARAAMDDDQPRRRPLARAWLALTAIVGGLGAGFHIAGVARQMGGWRNWRQNLLSGPPIPAPPASTALAIAGLSALGLRDREARQ